MIIKDSLKTIALSLIALSFIGVASAWTEPTSNPPAGNTSAPLLTEPTTSQTTTETLQVNGLRNVGGTVLDGSVSIGPVEILDTVLTFSRKDATYPTIFKLGTDNALVIQNSNKDTITLKDGSVGIGTGETAPASKLEIKSTLDEILRLTRDGGTSPTIFRQGEDDTLVINSNNKDAMTIKGDNVGIGMPHKYFYKGGAISTGWIVPRCQCDTSTNESWVSCNNFYTNTDEGAVCYDQYKTGAPFYYKRSAAFNRENAPSIIYTAGRNVSIDGAAALNSTLNVIGQSTLNSSLNVAQGSILKGDVIVGNEINSQDRTYKTQTFTSSGTFNFNIPATGVTMVTVSMSGGGGGGSSGGNSYGGPGGGGAQAVSKQDVPVIAGESITVTIGAGGTGGAQGSRGASGINGGTSSFGNYISTFGGYAGSGSGPGSAGGSGGENGQVGGSGGTGGYGGSSTFGSRTAGDKNAGNNGAGYGSGGSGGGGGLYGGGGGAPGYVFVEWYETTTPLFGASKLRVNGESLFLADKKIDDNTSNYYVSNKRYHVEASKVKADNTRNTVPLDMTVVNDLCKDEDGCSVTVGMRNWDSTGKPGAVATRGPYKFFMSKTSDWWRLSNDAEAKDGNGTVNHIIDAWSCLLTDGEYISGTMTDSSVQLGLLNANRAGYTDTNMVCLLTIDD